MQRISHNSTAAAGASWTRYTLQYMAPDSSRTAWTCMPSVSQTQPTSSILKILHMPSVPPHLGTLHLSVFNVVCRGRNSFIQKEVKDLSACIQLLGHEANLDDECTAQPARQVSCHVAQQRMLLPGAFQQQRQHRLASSECEERLCSPRQRHSLSSSFFAPKCPRKS